MSVELVSEVVILGRQQCGASGSMLLWCDSTVIAFSLASLLSCFTSLSVIIFYANIHYNV